MTSYQKFSRLQLLTQKYREKGMLWWWWKEQRFWGANLLWQMFYTFLLHVLYIPSNFVQETLCIFLNNKKCPLEKKLWINSVLITLQVLDQIPNLLKLNSFTSTFQVVCSTQIICKFFLVSWFALSIVYFPSPILDFSTLMLRPKQWHNKISETFLNLTKK